jgi:hypothetical protein
MESTMVRRIAAALFESLPVSLPVITILISGIVISVTLTEGPRGACQ